MSGPADLYGAIGGASGCRALAVAFYARVERDPILRPLFPSTFTCAIEEFSAFLAQFLGGESEATQRRWWLSLRESHKRFAIGQREREAWLRAMAATLRDESLIPDARVRNELMVWFGHSSAYVVNEGEAARPAQMLSGEMAELWNEQVALDEAVKLMSARGQGERALEVLRSGTLLARFVRCPAVHASVVALAAGSGPLLREYAVQQIRSHPALVHERYKGGRTLLHDAAASGDAGLVEELLEMGAGAGDGTERSPLYCVGNECSRQGAAAVVRALLRRYPEMVNVAHGVKRCTALHMAARRGNMEAIGALLDGGADIEARDSAGETPLRRAVNCNKVGAAKLLLARGANAQSRSKKGVAAAEAARSSEMRLAFSGRMGR